MNAPRLRLQSGLTLLEMLVAAAIGLVVLAGAGTIFAAANTGHIAQTDDANAEEGGRYALEVIGRAIRQAGYVDWTADASASNGGPPALQGLDAASLDKTSAGLAHPLTASLNGSDVLAVHFDGAGRAPDGDGSVLNCAGFAVPERQQGWSIFYLARSADGTGELRCKYKARNGWSADAVVSGVDGFQVLYGLDTDVPADGVPNRYVNASAIDDLDGALVPSGASEEARRADLNARSWWRRVVSVRYALLLRGARSPAGASAARTYDLLGAAYAGNGGNSDAGTRLVESTLAGRGPLRNRQLFTATVAVRGRP